MNDLKADQPMDAVIDEMWHDFLMFSAKHKLNKAQGMILIISLFESWKFYCERKGI